MQKEIFFFPLTDCSGVTAPRYTEYTDILKAPVVQMPDVANKGD